MDILHTIAECLGLRTTSVHNVAASGFKRQTVRVSDKSPEDVVNEMIQTILMAEKNGSLLPSRLRDIIGAETWKEAIAKAILSNLEQLIQRNPNTIGRALHEAIEITDEVVQEIFQFAADHPVLCTLIALGVLVLIAPWLIEALGFGELGHSEGT
jgi:hypothetical protein